MVPALLKWLHELKKAGTLRGCGGFANVDGGLTLFEASNLIEAKNIAAASPQAPLGKTEVFEWEVYDANLKFEGAFPK